MRPLRPRSRKASAYTYALADTCVQVIWIIIIKPCARANEIAAWPARKHFTTAINVWLITVYIAPIGRRRSRQPALFSEKRNAFVWALNAVEMREIKKQSVPRCGIDKSGGNTRRLAEPASFTSCCDARVLLMNASPWSIRMPSESSLESGLGA